MAKPTLSNQIKTEATLLKYAENVFKKSTENASLFPEATALLAELGVVLELFRDGITEANYRDKRQVVIKNQYGSRLKQALYHLSLHVELVANGDANLILAAGFIPSKAKVSGSYYGLSPKPNGLVVQLAVQGLLIAEMAVKSWKGARFYQFEYRAVGTVPWTTVISPKSKITIKDLEHLKEYEFRVIYLGPDPTPVYSDVVRCYIV